MEDCPRAQKRGMDAAQPRARWASPSRTAYGVGNAYVFHTGLLIYAANWDMVFLAPEKGGYRIRLYIVIRVSHLRRVLPHLHL